MTEAKGAAIVKYLLSSLVLALGTTGLVAPASAQGLAGAYLAGRQATIANDYEGAAQYFSQALIADPGNPGLLEAATRSFLGMGDLDRAEEVAQRMIDTGIDSQMAWLATLTGHFADGDYAVALDDLNTGDRVGPMVDGLMKAWATVGMGNMTDALTAFDEISQTEGIEAFGQYHKALAYALAGDYESADEILASDLGLSRRGIVTRAQVLSQLERNEDALALVDATYPNSDDPHIAELRARLASGERLSFDMVESARDGAAEVLFMVSGALSSDADPGYTLMFARAAQALRSGQADYILLVATLLERLERHELASEAYAQIPRGNPAYVDAEIGRAAALSSLDRSDAAVEVLEQLSRDFSDDVTAQTALGDTLRQLERFEEAETAYSNAIENFTEDRPEQWLVYFARGITRERTDRWPGAEADFRKALELNPEQPQVLNYLGYSFVEMGQNMDEALDLIERAVAAQPNSGYITDSLGWVLFKMGDYDQAVVHLERAAELMAVDPVINDHLGDAYWAVGRKLEARFQWRRALSFDPEEDEAERIRRKLEVGLDAVRAEEGEAPLTVANDG